MVAAYGDVARSTPGHLVLYRVGEFYEVLQDAASIVSRALGIQLTRRRQKDAPDIPMCGVPASGFPNGSCFAQRAMLAAQSIPRTGSPSWKRKPSRNVNSQVRPSSEMVCPAAICGLGASWLSTP